MNCMDIWKTQYLRNLCKNIGEYGLNASAIPFTEGLPLYLRITDITEEGTYSDKQRVSVNYTGTEKLLKNNDFLFARTGATVGKTYLNNNTTDKIAFAGYLIRFVPDLEKIHPYFLSLYCQTEEYWNWVKICSARSGQPGISAEEYGKLPIPCPPVEEQRKIVEVLEKWDKAIGLTKRLIEQKELQKKYLMQQLLTGRTRLPCFTNKWKNIKLGECSEIYQPKTISSTDLISEGYPVFGANGQIGFYNQFNHKTWQIMITCRGATCGTVNRTYGEAWITGNAMVVNVDRSPIIDKLFLFYLLLSRNFSSIVSGSGQPQIVRSPLLKYSLHIPNDIKEQQTIAEVLSSVDKEIDLLKQKLTKLEEQKKGLMQILLTGEVRLIK